MAREMLVGAPKEPSVSPGRTWTALDDALTKTAARLGIAGSFILAVGIYGGVGLALPLATGASTGGFVVFNVVAVLWAWLISVSWLFTQVQSGYRRRLLEWTTNLRVLTAQEFEWIVGEMLRREGWDVEETGGEGEPDGNVDLRIRRRGRELLVQCKRWQSWPVGVDEVRKLAGTLMREGLRGNAGILVTLSTFTEPAVREANSLGVELVDGVALARRIDNVRAAEPCPSCGTPMLLGKSPRGWWLRCPRWSEGCSGKRDLSDEPATAIELLFANCG